MTSETPLRHNLFSGYYIFIRCAGRYTDSELLRMFGLSTYQRRHVKPSEMHPLRKFRDYATLADEGAWTLLADDWGYTLWHMPSTRPMLAKLGEICDVFACSIGDCDHSFDFEYYRDSRLVRRYIVTDPYFQGATVIEDFGDPLPSEAEAFSQADEMDRVLAIAASLGIKTDYTLEEIRLYVSPAPNDGSTRLS